MDHGRVAQTVLDAVGGPDNISAAAHCATRLRLVLNDQEKVDQATLDNDMDIKGTFSAGGMYQIIVGPGDVDHVTLANLADGNLDGGHVSSLYGLRQSVYPNP